MALSPSQRSYPHRKVSQTTYVTYLERSFLERKQREEEVAEWWESGVVEKLFERAQKGPSHAQIAFGFLKAAAKGLVALPESSRVTEWNRLLKAGAHALEKQQTQNAYWMSLWSDCPDLLIEGLGRGYDAFSSVSWLRPPVQEVLVRVIENKSSEQDFEFLSSALQVSSLRRASSKVLKNIFELLTWKPTSSNNVSHLETWARHCLAAGLDESVALNQWASHLSQGAIEWSEWLLSAVNVEAMSSEALSGLMSHPSGLEVARKLWTKGCSPYVIYTSSSFNSNEKILKSPWFDALEISTKGNSTVFAEWSKALWELIDKGDVPPPSPFWVKGLLTQFKKLNVGFELGSVCNSWLGRAPCWSAGEAEFSWVWLELVRTRLSQEKTWDGKTSALQALCNRENPWPLLGEMSSCSSVKSFWEDLVKEFPTQTIALGQKFPETLGVLTWEAWIASRNLRDKNWQASYLATFTEASRGSARWLREDVMTTALQKGSVNLIDALLKDGASLPKGDIWKTVRLSADAWTPHQIASLAKRLKEVDPSRSVFDEQDFPKLWRILRAHHQTTAEVVRSLLEEGAPSPKAEDIYGVIGSGSGCGLIDALVRGDKLDAMLPPQEVPCRPKPRF